MKALFNNFTFMAYYFTIVIAIMTVSMFLMFFLCHTLAGDIFAITFCISFLLAMAPIAFTE